jgi:hypothetical protein
MLMAAYLWTSVGTRRGDWRPNRREFSTDLGLLVDILLTNTFSVASDASQANRIVIRSKDASDLPPLAGPTTSCALPDLSPLGGTILRSMVHCYRFWIREGHGLQ